MIPYRANRNPGTVFLNEVLNHPEKGTNCELLVHAITRARGFKITEGIRSSELYADTACTQAVGEISHVQTGDIIGLCPDNKIGFMGIHVGILYVDEAKAIYVVHNARHVGFGQRQRLEDAVKYQAHGKIAWVKRPIINDPALSNPGLLRKLGFEYLVKNI